MMSYENITQASTPEGWSQSVTHEKKNNQKIKCQPYIKMSVVSIGNVRTSPIIRDRNYRVD